MPILLNIANFEPVITRIKLFIVLMILGVALVSQKTIAQCSICTRTAQQLGEKPAKGMNSGILYLAFAPFAIVGFVAYRWWKNNNKKQDS